MAANPKLLDFVYCELLREKERRGYSAEDQWEVELRLRNRGLPAYPLICERARTLLPPEERRDILAPLQNLRRIQFLLLFLFFIFGCISGAQVFVAVNAAAANFFWLLLALVGLNLTSLLVWLVLLFTPATDMIGSTLRRFFYWIMRGKTVTNPALLVWRRAFFESSAGKWHLSLLLHGIWIVLLLGFLLATGLMLATRQYDFVWETTILRPDTFVSLTQWLSWLPAHLGVAVPDSEQVAVSQLGGSPGEPALVRILWSNLLLSSLIFYGLAPRALALLGTLVLRHRGWSKLRPDLSLPYYIRLKDRLSPSALQEGILDADDHSRSQSPQDSGIPDCDLRNILHIENIYLVGLEWAAPWPPDLSVLKLQQLRIGHVGPNVTDRRSRDLLRSEQDHVRSQPVIVIARLEATPDRGVQQILRSLAATASELRLMLVDLAPGLSNESRYRDWQSTASAAGIEPAFVCVHRVGMTADV